MASGMRLDKYLADQGAGTRSQVKKFIQKGEVLLDGETVKRPETRVIPGENIVTLRGEVLGPLPQYEYYLLHKPAGYVTATEDERERTVMELVPSRRKGLFPVGRLDKDTEGLLIITNDGPLAHQLLSPKKHVEKTYFVLTAGKVTEEDKTAMKEGVDIGEEVPTLPARLEILEGPKGFMKRELFESFQEEEESCVLLSICEGKYHQVKRMMEAVGKKVLYLKRVSMGPLRLPEDLERGGCRALTEEEVRMLKGIHEEQKE